MPAGDPHPDRQRHGQPGHQPHQWLRLLRQVRHSTWTLTGDPVNSVSSWTITGGTLAISDNVFGASAPVSFSNATLATSGNVLLSEPLQFQGSSGISVASGSDLILASTLSGSGTFTKSGDGALILSGNGDGFAGSMILDAMTSN
ncbi:MAG: hypothetical protein HZT43_00125 [Exiguobacterium profundum]|nr:MAG: hypothetical protein HZT43_00125 [Exiguobacterium profundum]